MTDFTYERQFSPPQVQLVAANLSPLRQPSRVGDTLAFDIAEQPLAVSVTFPDGVGRKIASLRLEVTNPTTSNVIQSRLELDPATDASGNYLIVWPLADYNAPGTSRPVTLTIDGCRRTRFERGDHPGSHCHCRRAATAADTQRRANRFADSGTDSDTDPAERRTAAGRNRFRC